MRSYDPDKLYQVLRDIFGEQYETRRNEFRIDCINCDDDNGNLEISLDKGIFHCWQCEYSGNLRKLLKDYLGKSPNLEEYVSPSDLLRMDIAFDVEEEKPVFKPFNLPIEYVPFDGRKLGFVGQKAHRYALSRMTDEDIKHYQIGYCGLGDYKWRIIVPVFQGKDVVYFVGRAFMGHKDLPYRNPDKEECGVGKEEIIFNFDGAKKENQAVICEGVFDAIRVGNDGVAIFGTYPSSQQIERLTQLKKLFVMLDADALDKAVKMAIRLKEQDKSIIYVVEISEGDPDNYERPTLRDMINRARPFSLAEEQRLSSLLQKKSTKNPKKPQ